MHHGCPVNGSAGLASFPGQRLRHPKAEAVLRFLACKSQQIDTLSVVREDFQKITLVEVRVDSLFVVAHQLAQTTNCHIVDEPNLIRGQIRIA
jgi:hypothetical protein